MDIRVPLAAALGLLLLAFGGFYFAFIYRAQNAWTPPSASRPAAAPSTSAAAPASGTARVTPASIEAEIAKTEHAELQAILKKHFEEEYKELIATAVRKRSEGVSDEEFGRELSAQFQAVMRSKLQFAVAAEMPAIDRLAANEVALFQGLSTGGAPHCLNVLGREDTPPPTPVPDDVRRAMRLATLYRFQAIVDGMPRFRPLTPLRPDEMSVFEAGLTRAGLSFEEMRTGGFLNSPGELGTPCRKIATMYRVIADLGEETRRKLYSGMFFLGRDK